MNERQDERHRLLQIMEKEDMNAKQFATEVGISQGTLSNIMSGRNRPSLDVLQAILRRFGTIQSDWLVMGIGGMYRPTGAIVEPTLFDVRPDDSGIEMGQGKRGEATGPVERDVQHESLLKESAGKTVKESVGSKQVRKIVVFYSDGTYEER